MQNSDRVSRRMLIGLKSTSKTNEDIKQLAQIKEQCLALNSVSCRSCEDYCEERAIRFQPRLGRCEVPSISTEMCTGCGDCMTSCPVDAIQLVAVGENNMEAI